MVNYFDGLFSNNVTVNIQLGYREIAGNSLAPGDPEESQSFFDPVSYQQAVNALQVTGTSISQSAADATLPGSSPLSGGALWLTTAQENAVGLLSANNSANDGYVGINSADLFSTAPGVTPSANQYYLIGVLEHEFSEVMGRDSLLGDGLGGTTSYGLLDLFRFSASGTRQLSAGAPAYFSTDGGITNLNNFNTGAGDIGDWAGSSTDAFNAASVAGVVEPVSTVDVTELNTLGWNTTPPVTGPQVASVAATTGDFNAGQSLTLTLNMSEAVNVTGTPTLTLNAGGIAT